MISTSFWEKALKYNAPATIAGAIFFYIILDILKIKLVQENPPLLALVCILLFNFCAYIIFKNNINNSEKKLSPQDIHDNDINNNEIDNDLCIGSEASNNISGNKIEKNKIKGNLIIGRDNKVE